MKIFAPQADSHRQLIDALAAKISLSTEQQAYCRRSFSPRHYARKEYLLNVGEVWREMFFVIKGALRLFYTSKDGREFNKGFFFEQQFVWPIAPIARHEPSRFTIAALEDTELLVADFQTFKAWLQNINGWAGFALSHAEWLAEQKVMREAEFLLDLAEQRYLRFTREYAAQLERIPDYHIASYLGITNVSLSRIKKKLADV